MNNIKILENKILTNNGEEFGFLRFIPIKQENLVIENEKGRANKILQENDN